MFKNVAYISVFGILVCLICAAKYVWNYFSMPYFSIITSVYNYEQYVAQTIESILESDYPRFELILVNDGSTDNSLNIMKKYAEKDSRITLIDQENQGLSLARNNAMKIAKGDYVWFVDADDYIAPHALKKLAAQIEKTKMPDIVSFLVQPVDATGRFLYANMYQSLPIELKRYSNRTVYTRSLPFDIIVQYPVTSGKQVYRKQFLSSKKIEFIPHLVFEDDVFFLTAIEANARATAIFEPLYFKRMHASAITSNRARYYSSTVKLPMILYEETKRMLTTEERSRTYFSLYFMGIFGKFPGNKYNLDDLKVLESWLEERQEDVFFKDKLNKVQSFVKEKTQAFLEAEAK